MARCAPAAEREPRGQDCGMSGCPRPRSEPQISWRPRGPRAVLFLQNPPGEPAPSRVDAQTEQGGQEGGMWSLARKVGRRPGPLGGGGAPVWLALGLRAGARGLGPRGQVSSPRRGHNVLTGKTCFKPDLPLIASTFLWSVSASTFLSLRSPPGYEGCVHGMTDGCLRKPAEGVRCRHCPWGLPCPRDTAAAAPSSIANILKMY